MMINEPVWQSTMYCVYENANVTKPGRARTVYAYRVLALRSEAIKDVQDVANAKLLEQVAFYADRAFYEGHVGPK